jgi:hypothetical protein
VAVGGAAEMVAEAEAGAVATAGSAAVMGNESTAVGDSGDGKDCRYGDAGRIDGVLRM